MTIIGSMNIAKTALNVNQFALNVVSNNIANMNTEGYLKQRVNLVELKGYTPYASSKGIQIYDGGGVGISDISQYTNQAGFGNLIGQNSLLAGLNSQLGGLDDLAGILNEIGDGSLSNAMAEFYSAAQYLSQNPADSVLRINYVNAAQNVAETFNKLSTALTSKRNELVGDVNIPGSVAQSQAGIATSQVNDILAQIAGVNNAIIQTGDSSNELMTERNNLLAELSEYVDFSTVQNPNGTINIQIAGIDVVAGAEQAAQLKISVGDVDNPAKISIETFDTPPQVKVSDIREKLNGGQLKGILTAASANAEGMTFQKVQAQINLLAKTFAEEVNSIQTYKDATKGAMAIGLDADGNQILIPATQPLFEVPAGGVDFDASNIKLNQLVYDNPNLVAAARVDIAADGNPLDPRAVGDTNNLKEILNLQNKNFAQLGGVTISTALKNLVTKVGLEAGNLKNKVDAQANVVDQASTKYYSDGGVNLDEELIDMIKYQRAYEAASRVVSACNEMLQILVSLGR